MDREDTKFKISKKIRIATFIVLILCAILASIAWALFAGVMMTGNNLRFGKIHVCIGYYDDSGEQKLFTSDQAMINGNEKGGKPVDADAVIKDRHKGDGEWEQWKVCRTFFVKNCTDDVDGACYYRIYISPAPNDPDRLPEPYYNALGNYLEVSIWEVTGWKIVDGHRTPVLGTDPIIKNVLANNLNQKWYDSDTGRDYLLKQTKLLPGESKDFYLEMSYSDEFETEYINTKSYEFDISVEAVQVKNNEDREFND